MFTKNNIIKKKKKKKVTQKKGWDFNFTVLMKPLSPNLLF